jgi:hypothetical protein
MKLVSAIRRVGRPICAVIAAFLAPRPSTHFVRARCIVAANPQCPAYPGNELISHRFVVLSLHHPDFLANICYTLPTYAAL